MELGRVGPTTAAITTIPTTLPPPHPESRATVSSRRQQRMRTDQALKPLDEKEPDHE